MPLSQLKVILLLSGLGHRGDIPIGINLLFMVLKTKFG